MLCYQRISRKNQKCSELCLPQIYCHSLPWNIYSKTTRRKECLAAPKVMPSDSPGRISTRFSCRTLMILWNHWNQSIAFRDVQSKNATNALRSTLININHVEDLTPQYQEMSRCILQIFLAERKLPALDKRPWVSIASPRHPHTSDHPHYPSRNSRMIRNDPNAEME